MMKYKYENKEDKLKDHIVYRERSVIVEKRDKYDSGIFKFRDVFVRFARNSLELSDHSDFYPQLMYFPLYEISKIEMDIEEEPVNPNEHKTFYSNKCNY